MATEQPRRRADAERNAESILTETCELLARGNILTMSDVAAAAGVTRATLYSHFATLELLLDAVVARAIAETDLALSALKLSDFDVDEALERLVRTSWPILDRYRTIRLAALKHINHTTLRSHHDTALRHIEKLIDRGQISGAIRTDLSRDWLVATFYALLHTAADEVDAERLNPQTAADALLASLRSLLYANLPDNSGQNERPPPP